MHLDMEDMGVRPSNINSVSCWGVVRIGIYLNLTLTFLREADSDRAVIFRYDLDETISWQKRNIFSCFFFPRNLNLLSTIFRIKKKRKKKCLSMNNPIVESWHHHDR